MPYPLEEIKNELGNTLRIIENAIYKKIQPLEITIWKTSEPVPFEQRFWCQPTSIICLGERRLSSFI